MIFNSNRHDPWAHVPTTTREQARWPAIPTMPDAQPSEPNQQTANPTRDQSPPLERDADPYSQPKGSGQEEGGVDMECGKSAETASPDPPEMERSTGSHDSTLALRSKLPRESAEYRAQDLDVAEDRDVSEDRDESRQPVVEGCEDISNDERVQERDGNGTGTNFNGSTKGKMVEKEKSSAPLQATGGERTDEMEDETGRGGAMETVVDSQGHERTRNGGKGTDLDTQVEVEESRPQNSASSPNMKTLRIWVGRNLSRASVQELSMSINNAPLDSPASAPASPEMEVEEVFNDIGDRTIVIPRIRASATDFTNMAVFTHIDLIQEPEYATRHIEDKHVEDMKAALANGYTASAGVLAVSLPPASVHLARDARPGQELSFRTILVDGRHRLRALKFLRDNQTQNGPNWRSITSRLEVRLYIHKQNIPVDNFMTIALGQHLNTATTVSLPTKFRSRIEAGISSLHSLAKRLNKEVRQLTIEQSVQSIQDSGNIGRLERQATTRYTAIALRLARSEEQQQIFLKLCRKHEFLGLVYFQSPYFVNSNDGKLSFLMACLEVYAEGQAARDGRRQNFEPIREAFHLFAGEMFEMTMRLSIRVNVPFQQILQQQASFRPGTAVRTVMQHILTPLRDFKLMSPTQTRNRMLMNKRRLRRIHLNLYPNDPITPRPGSPPVDLTGEPEDAVRTETSPPQAPSQPSAQAPSSASIPAPEPERPASSTSSGNSEKEPESGVEESEESDESVEGSPSRPSTPPPRAPSPLPPSPLPPSPPRRSARLQGHQPVSTSGMQGQTPPRSKRGKKVIVEGSSDDENENVSGRNTKKVSGRKRKFDELVEAIRSLSDSQQES